MFSAPGEKLVILASEDAIQVLNTECTNTKIVFSTPEEELRIRVSQKNQKSEFCFATKPTGFHRLDEPPEKISAL